MTEHQSSRTVAVALASNLGVALAKTAAALVTGSTVMSAEAAHAFADTGNQVLLVVAQRSSDRRSDKQHPLGYGREAYFWALIASVVVFAAGALFSLREGIEELISPLGASSFLVVYTVLGVSAVLDSLSLLQAVHQLRAEARLLRRDFLDQVMLTSDPTTRAVFAEDSAAVVGDAVAFAGVAVHQATRSSAPEGIAAVLIGLLLVGVGLQLARRNRDFLLGEQAPAAAREAVRAFLADVPGVVEIDELLMTFIGPRRVWVVARVDIDDALHGDEVEHLVKVTESGLKQLSAYITRVDVVPIGRLDPLAVSIEKGP